MYLPPFDSMLRSIGVDRVQYASARDITIPKELFSLLLQVALASSEFNEAGYLEENPDIADAVARGTIENPHMHYVGFGFFEGRLGATPMVDERWYMQTYTDVGQAVKQGKIGSAKEHYYTAGAAEGRSPNPRHLAVATQWKKALVAR